MMIFVDRIVVVDQFVVSAQSITATVRYLSPSREAKMRTPISAFFQWDSTKVLLTLKFAKFSAASTATNLYKVQSRRRHTHVTSISKLPVQGPMKFQRTSCTRETTTHQPTTTCNRSSSSSSSAAAASCRCSPLPALFPPPPPPPLLFSFSIGRTRPDPTRPDP
jgi:hypothetical protein